MYVRYLCIEMLTNAVVIARGRYFDTYDSSEACRCIFELNAPHFHHQLVFLGLGEALRAESTQTNYVDMFIALLLRAAACGLLTTTQMAIGLNHVMSDKSLYCKHGSVVDAIVAKIIRVAVKEGAVSLSALKLPDDVRAIL